MSNPTLRILQVAVVELSPNEWRPLKQAWVADQLGMTQPDVAKYLKVLVADGVLLAGPKDGLSNTYRLNRNNGLLRRMGWHQPARNA